jgi:hypothetical protein
LALRNENTGNPDMQNEKVVFYNDVRHAFSGLMALPESASGDSESSEGRIARLARRIVLAGNPADGQRQRMLERAGWRTARGAEGPERALGPPTVGVFL